MGNKWNGIYFRDGLPDKVVEVEAQTEHQAIDQLIALNGMPQAIESVGAQHSRIMLVPWWAGMEK